jgi:hypothetical protein
MLSGQKYNDIVSIHSIEAASIWPPLMKKIYKKSALR